MLRRVLGRHHDLGRFDRLAVLVAQRHLALGVGPERLRPLPEWRASDQQTQDLVA
jgi:hypothetical protein